MTAPQDDVPEFRDPLAPGAEDERRTGRDRAVDVFAFVGWDGALPLISAAVGPVVYFLTRSGLAVAVAAAFAVPVIALFRCQIAQSQLVGRFGDRPPAWRQVLMAFAILVLMAFDLVGYVFFMRAVGRPMAAADVAAFAAAFGAMYVTYLGLIYVAVWSPRRGGA